MCFSGALGIWMAICIKETRGKCVSAPNVTILKLRMPKGPYCSHVGPRNFGHLQATNDTKLHTGLTCGNLYGYQSLGPSVRATLLVQFSNLFVVYADLLLTEPVVASFSVSIRFPCCGEVILDVVLIDVDRVCLGCFIWSYRVHWACIRRSL